MCNARWRDAGAWLIDLRDDEEANDRLGGAAQNYVTAIERLLRGPPSRVAVQLPRVAAGDGGAGPRGRGWRRQPPARFPARAE